MQIIQRNHLKSYIICNSLQSANDGKLRKWRTPCELAFGLTMISKWRLCSSTTRNIAGRFTHRLFVLNILSIELRIHRFRARWQFRKWEVQWWSIKNCVFNFIEIFFLQMFLIINLDQLPEFTDTLEFINL